MSVEGDFVGGVANEVSTEVLKLAPPATVATMTILGYSLSDWVLLLTAIYTLLQIVWLGRKYLRARRADARHHRPAPGVERGPDA